MQTPETAELDFAPTSTHLDLTPLHNHHILEPPGGLEVGLFDICD